MYKKLLTSLTFLTIFLIVLVNIVINYYMANTAFFGLDPNNTMAKVFLFNPKAPLNYFGITFISSIFYHKSIHHLVSNLILFFFASISLEKKLGKLRMLQLYLFTNVLTLFVILINYSIITPSKTILLSGISLIASALLSFNFVYFKKTFMLILCGIVFAFYGFQSTSEIIDPHIISYVIGGVLAFYVNKRLKAI